MMRKAKLSKRSEDRGNQRLQRFLGIGCGGDVTAGRYGAYALGAAIMTAALLAAPGLAWTAGMTHSANFIVLADDEQLAEALLTRADQFREDVAKEWLGQPLPPSVGPTIIDLEISATEDRGMTWRIDNPKRKYHRIWLVTNAINALGGTLRHEITHTVLATRFPNRLPIWAEEGAASLSDDPARVAIRRGIINWYAETGNWPDLAAILQAQAIASQDQAAYSAAASVTEYLLSLTDKTTFVTFANASSKDLDAALQKYFAIRDVQTLQSRWQAWVKGRAQIATQPPRVGPAYLALRTRDRR